MELKDLNIRRRKDGKEIYYDGGYGPYWLTLELKRERGKVYILELKFESEEERQEIVDKYQMDKAGCILEYVKPWSHNQRSDYYIPSEESI